MNPGGNTFSWMDHRCIPSSGYPIQDLGSPIEMKMQRDNVPRNPRRVKHGYKAEEIIFAVAFVAVFSLLIIPSEKVSGSPVPTIIFNGKASWFHTYVLALNFAFCGAVMTIFLRHMYPGFARYTKLLSILSMSVAVGVLSWLAVPLLLHRVASLLLGGVITP